MLSYFNMESLHTVTTGRATAVSISSRGFLKPQNARLTTASQLQGKNQNKQQQQQNKKQIKTKKTTKNPPHTAENIRTHAVNCSVSILHTHCSCAFNNTIIFISACDKTQTCNQLQLFNRYFGRIHLLKVI